MDNFAFRAKVFELSGIFIIINEEELFRIMFFISLSVISVLIIVKFGTNNFRVIWYRIAFGAPKW